MLVLFYKSKNVWYWNDQLQVAMGGFIYL